MLNPSLCNVATGKQSQGLPVGLLEFIVLAEACLIDVDNFLLRQDVPFTRYVDDFRIFCTSRNRQSSLNTHWLNTFFRSIDSRSSPRRAPSRISKNSLKEELSDPEEVEQQARVDRMNQLFKEIAEENGPYWYEGLDEDNEEEILSQAQKDSFIALFEQSRQKASTPSRPRATPTAQRLEE